jgi:hypothetical protein
MKHITKAHINRAKKEHHMIGKMLGISDSHKRFYIPENMDKKTYKKAVNEHHFLGNLIGMLAKGIGMGAKVARATVPIALRSANAGIKGLGKSAGFLAKNAGNIGHAVNAAGSAAQAGMALKQMRQANKVSAAQERMMNAQAQSAEDQNAYVRRQMEAAQGQKKGGRTKSYKKH